MIAENDHPKKNKLAKAFILYLPGHAGNFLSRVFSLGEDTVPQLPRELLHNVIDTKIIPGIDRLSLYRFSKVSERYTDWQCFHRAWTDYCTDHFLYDDLAFDAWQNRLLICALHPHEFDQLRYHIHEDHSDKFIAVNLEPRHLDWVERSQRSLHFVLRPNEIQRFHILAQEFSMFKLNFSTMLDSVDGFTDEYLRTCDFLSVKPQIETAQMLYHDWRQTRYDRNFK